MLSKIILKEGYYLFNWARRWCREQEGKSLHFLK